VSAFKLTPDAKSSLMQIARYTEQHWGKRQRNIYLGIIDDCFHALSENPHMGTMRPEIHHALRSQQVGKHVVFYTTQQDFIVIVHILHQRMEPASHLN